MSQGPGDISRAGRGVLRSVFSGEGLGNQDQCGREPTLALSRGATTSPIHNRSPNLGAGPNHNAEPYSYFTLSVDRHLYDIISRTAWEHQTSTGVERPYIFEQVLPCLKVGHALDTRSVPYSRETVMRAL
jgi:hypothetical protein